MRIPGRLSNHSTQHLIKMIEKNDIKPIAIPMIIELDARLVLLLEKESLRQNRTTAEILSEMIMMHLLHEK